MKFSENGLYVERYIKCRNCGVLIYDSDRKAARERDGSIYCSEWCVEWFDDREQRRADKQPAST
jgi:hypothetical protein